MGSSNKVKLGSALVIASFPCLFGFVVSEVALLITTSFAQRSTLTFRSTLLLLSAPLSCMLYACVSSAFVRAAKGTGRA